MEGSDISVCLHLHQTVEDDHYESPNAGIIARNPFSDYHPKKTTKERDYLIESELQALMNHKFAFDGYGKVRDMFVFSCFSGMAHADVKGLMQEMIQRSFDGVWIVKRRQKTDTLFKIKLCGITKRIIARYKREVAGTNLVLPVPDIAYCNRVLKKIAAEVGIDKTITYHMIRHTFATTNALAQGIRIEVVSRMLGHTNIKTTQIYAKVTEVTLLKLIISKATTWFPYFREMIRMESVCRTTGFDDEQIATLIKGKPVEYSGELYSEEHNYKFAVERVTAQIMPDLIDKRKLQLNIDKVPFNEWCRMKFERLRQTIRSPKQRGIKL